MSNKTKLQNPLEINVFLHNSIRLQIIAQLYSVKRLDMKYLRDFLNLSWGNLSFHITKLEEKGYVTIKKDYIGKIPYTLIQITEEGRKQFNIYRKKMSTFLNLFK